jgi:predicted DCC family thiol-disulfide oxidoreductase YuxK
MNKFKINKGKIVILFDGLCTICNTGIRILNKISNNFRITICPMESAKGIEILKSINIENSPDTIIVIDENNYYTNSKAIKKIVSTFTGLAAILKIIYIIPNFIINIFYNLIAKNRYKFFKKHEICPLSNLKEKMNLEILN